MDFKYKTKFNCEASLKWVDTSKKESLAAVGLESLQDLRSLAWADEDIAKNPDILVWVANFAVPNVANLNGHLIETETAIRIADSMKNKPLNCEHDRNYIIGCVTNVGFSSYNSNKLVQREELAGTNNPFNVAAAGIVWKIADRWMAEMLKESNQKGSYLHEKMSTSWEIGYNSYKILRGSRNISNGELIDDEKEIEKLSKYLMDNGGTGLDKDGQELYTVICGDDAVFLGLAVTSNPAAAVKGIGIVSPDEKEDDDDKTEKSNSEKAAVDQFSESFSAVNDKINELSQNFNNKISQTTKTIVKLRNTMKFKDKESLLDALEVSEASAVTPRMIREYMEESIQEAASKYQVLEQAKAAQETELKDTLAKAKASEDQIQALANEIQALKDEAEKTKKEQIFTDRMSALAEIYNLDNEKVRKKVAKEIRDLADTDYTAWLEDDASVLLTKKEVKAEPTEDEKEAAAAKALAESKASAGFIPNTSNTDENTKTAKAWKLGEDFEIKR